MLPKRHKLGKKNFSHPRGWRSFSSAHLTLRTKEAPDTEPSKFSFVVSKKVSKKSVIRNKLKRQGYRAVQTVIRQIPKNAFCIFFFKGTTTDSTSYEKIRDEIIFLLIKAGVLSH